MLKTETMIHFLYYFMNCKIKIEIVCNNEKVFTVTFDPFKVSFMNKNFPKKKN